MKKIITFLLLIFYYFPSQAQQIPLDEATQTAMHFFGPVTRASLQVELAYTSTVNGKNHYFVFNSPTKNGGFVIVGADKAAKEVLGYCEKGSFDYNELPENFKWWLNQYNLQIEEGIRQGIDSRANTPMTRAANIIDPLIKTQWKQSEPYNNMIPSISANSEKFVTGCVATAMAQIMNYHKYPEQGNGSNSYSLKYNDKTVTFSADFGNTTYNWDNLSDYYGENANEEEYYDVAKLMYHCGVSVDMLYDTSSNGGSGAYIYKVSDALINYFNYNKSLRYLQRRFYSDSEWEKLLYEELESGRPMLYGGSGSYGGHAFICDGYDGTTDKYHFNWGWGGSYDGYYSINGTGALAPLAILGNVDKPGFTDEQEVIIGIRPNVGDNYVYTMGLYYETGETNPIKINQSVVKRGDIFKVSCSLLNTSSTTINAEIGVKIFNEKEDPIIIKFYDLYDLKTNNYVSGEWSVNSISIPEGEYNVSLVFKTDNEWKDFQWNDDINKPTIEIVKPDVDYLITSTPTVGNGEYVISDGKKFKISFKVKNFTNNKLSIPFRYYVYPYRPELMWAILAMSYNKTVTLEPNAEQEVVLKDESTTVNFDVNSTYFFQLSENGNNLPYSYFRIVDEKTVPYSISSVGIGTIILPFDAEVPDNMKVYSCNNESNGTLVLKEVDKIHQFEPYIVVGEAGQYAFSGPNVPSNATYYKGWLKGILGNYNLLSNDYLLQADGSKAAFHKVGDGAAKGKVASKNRCVLSIPTSQSDYCFSSLMLPDINNTTGIDIENQDNNDVISCIYSIDGKPLNKLQKGLNIIRKANGTTIKVLVK